MKGYIIKVTYLTGIHAGRSYLIERQGFVANERKWFWKDNVYRTEASVKAACTRYTNSNRMSYEDERIVNDLRIKKGMEGKRRFIHELELYEPYEVDFTNE